MQRWPSKQNFNAPLPSLLCLVAATPGSHFTPKAVCKKIFSREEKGSRFFEGEVRQVQSSSAAVISSALQLQKNDASRLQKFFNALRFHGAAKDCLHFIPLTSMTNKLRSMQIAVSLHARPSSRTGACGARLRGTRRARTM
jgi:hypothetical protein